MKPFYFSLIVGLLVSCSGDEQPVQKQQQQIDSLQALLNTQKERVNNVLASFIEIQSNLDSVARKQNIISLYAPSKGEIGPDAKEKINLQIRAINDLMDKNKAQIAQLTKKLSVSNMRNSEFSQMINMLNTQLANKNNELAELNHKLNKLSTEMTALQTSFDSLSGLTLEQSSVIETQTKAIHTAYYLVGESKELQNKNVIDKTGGLLGIGKTSKLHDEYDPALFVKIDYTQVLTIPVFAKKARVITTHPADSYFMDKNEREFTNLRITQPEKFWGASKYLVIVSN